MRQAGIAALVVLALLPLLSYALLPAHLDEIARHPATQHMPAAPAPSPVPAPPPDLSTAADSQQQQHPAQQQPLFAELMKPAPAPRAAAASPQHEHSPKQQRSQQQQQQQDTATGAEAQQEQEQLHASPKAVLGVVALAILLSTAAAMLAYALADHYNKTEPPHLSPHLSPRLRQGEGRQRVMPL